MGDILRQLPFHATLFLLATDVVDGDLIGAIQEENALDQEDLAVLVDGQRIAQHLFLAVRIMAILDYKRVDLL